MKTKLTSISLFILSFILPAIAFYAVYRYTDQLFQRQRFPYPFEFFGIAAGLGTACWVYVTIKIFQRMIRKFKKLPPSPYVIEQKVKIEQDEVLK